MNRKQTERYGRLVLELSKYGFDLREIDTLIRAEKALTRWSTLECGDGNNYGSWAIERDETTGKPYMVHHHYLHGRGKDYTTRTAIPNKEASTLARIDKIVKAHSLTYYHQGDPRGCSLYIIRPGDIRDGQKVDACYNHGLAICID